MTTVCIKMCEKFGDEAEHGNEPYEREIPVLGRKFFLLR